MNSGTFRTWIEISTKAIKNNLTVFKKTIGPKVRLLVVVKSNAYGHELMGFAKAAAQLGADFLGVDSITEARALRSVGIKKPILVLGYTLPALFDLAEEKGIGITISSFENLSTLIKSKKKVSVHIKVDTGMHRQGFFVTDLQKVCQLLQKNSSIKFEGLYTHFACAKRPDSSKETEKQIANFKQAIEIVKSNGFNPLCHAAATAGTLNYPEAHFDMARVGIGMYGLWPSPETKEAFEKKLILKPALSWKSMVSEVKWLEKNEKIGYDFTETLKEKTKLAVVPIGYWHGYWRAFSSKAFVLVGGKRCSVVGRVSMDMIVVNVTNVKNAHVGAEVVLLGKQGREEVSADELAKLAGTTNYEIVTRLNPLIKKIYL